MLAALGEPERERGLPVTPLRCDHCGETATRLGFFELTDAFRRGAVALPKGAVIRGECARLLAPGIELPSTSEVVFSDRA